MSADGQIVEGVERGRRGRRRAGFDPRTARRFAVRDADAAVPGGAGTGRARLKNGTQTIGSKSWLPSLWQNMFSVRPKTIRYGSGAFQFQLPGNILKKGWITVGCMSSIQFF